MLSAVVIFLQAFSNRELSIAIWIFILFIFCIFSSKIRKPLLNAMKAFFAWKLTVLYVLMILYISAVALIFYFLGIWKIAHLPMTILWIICVAFIMLFKFSQIEDKGYFINLIKDNFKGLVFIEFIVNMYVFNLWVELILVPFFAFIGGMLAIADTDSQYDVVKKVLNFIISFMGLIFLCYAIYMVLNDLKYFLTRENIEYFILPIIFSIMLLPFVYFSALFSSYEMFFTRLQFFISDTVVLKYTKRKTVFVFNFNLWELNNWSKYVISSWRFKSKYEVDEAIINFKSRN